MADLTPIKPAEHILSIDYAVRGPLEVIAKKLESEGKTILHLNIGDPAKFGTQKAPAELGRILLKKLENGECFEYGDSMGNPKIRGHIAANTRKNVRGINGNPVTKDDIFIGNGSSELITFCIEALLKPGDGILIPDPGYPLYEALIRKVRGEPQFYSLDENQHWSITEKSLEEKVNKNTKAVVVINPNNPTGRNYKKKQLEMVRKFADKHGLVVFADEVYSHLNYDGKRHVSLATLKGEYPIITFYSLSKNYLAPGFRVGWMIRTDPNSMTEKYWEAIGKLASIRLCSATLLQYAIMPTLTDRNTRKHTQISSTNDTFTNKLRKNARLTYEMLNNEKAGFSCVEPEAGFYAFPKIELPEGKTDFDFARDLLMHTGIYVNNGSGFGPGGKGHVRIVFLPEFDVLKEAYRRLIEFKKEYR